VEVREAAEEVEVEIAAPESPADRMTRRIRDAGEEATVA
jgi:hypothetical protein